jgi:hypothetical protein
MWLIRKMTLLPIYPVPCVILRGILLHVHLTVSYKLASFHLHEASQQYLQDNFVRSPRLKNPPNFCYGIVYVHGGYGRIVPSY